MSTKVTIKVPECADYIVVVDTKEGFATRTRVLLPGDVVDIYVHSGVEIKGVRNMPRDDLRAY